MYHGTSAAESGLIRNSAMALVAVADFRLSFQVAWSGHRAKHTRSITSKEPALVARGSFSRCSYSLAVLTAKRSIISAAVPGSPLLTWVTNSVA